VRVRCEQTNTSPLLRLSSAGDLRINAQDETPRAGQRQKITFLKGKRWDSLGIKADNSAKWYLLNCIVGTEKECLYQCQTTCQVFDSRDVVKFVVPVEATVKSRGSKLIPDQIVLYPGYVFAKLRLSEPVYEALSGLSSVRSWMGTIRKLRAGSFRTKPSIPTPIPEDQLKQYKGLEDVDNKPDSQNHTEHPSTSTLMDQFAHLEIGGMCKVVAEGPLKNEDGIVKRFKDGLVCVRMYTYGSIFDEWFDPQHVRSLTEDEVRQGIQAPEKPITQQQFNTQVLGMPPKEHTGELRQSLLGSISGPTASRNRKQDRLQRGETSQSHMDADALRQERLQWQQFQTDNRYNVPAQWGQKPLSQPATKSIQDAMDLDKDWSAFVGDATQSNTQDDAFFDDLLSELSAPLNIQSQKSDATQSQTPDATQSQKSDTTQSQTPDATLKSSSQEDDFFMALESSLETEVGKPQEPYTNTDEQDFFAQLEMELSDLSSSTTPKQSNPSEADLSQLTVPALKQKLKDQGLKVSGTKAELIQRLLNK